ncbi:uncharacterized protein Z518_05340 [Rhinocladiella mackenziei CBS 650.93]|uniref:BZIP domain-containing protein n=1 Tax=Rhinocladiella mackenziei CBS 650.93 TaxID=1442369 RepID=A0A0D2FQL8_9EURO|nr:uncharacterized protein Z518_05340 [Rhinocladiella mackenziei CBS 650.93]KIX04472.1 hypothetical protein Z518_05340 [Rhinocladiella mackenziei CBS 650.93]
MATHPASLGQRPSPTDSAESAEAKGISSRRLKKREIDRRCQRQARERTKSRIAYLEGLVEDFRQQDASGQVATLMKQLQETEAERDIMAKALKDIQKALDTHRPLKPTEEQPQDKNISVSHRFYEDANAERKPSLASLQDGASLSVLPGPIDAQTDNSNPASSFELAHFPPAPIPHMQAPGKLFAPEVVRLEAASPNCRNQAIVKSKSANDLHQQISYNNNWAIPRHTCSCHSSHNRPRGRRPVWQGNYWKFANEVLSEKFEWSEDVAPASDAVSDDVPVRALIEGWDAVAKRGPLHPSWQILRRIDETLFSMCPNTERLAIMRAMHTLLQFHTESSAERYARLPPWYMRRPSQRIAHSYAIDYFAWPGIRERFIFHEHDYCGNDFWHLFCRSIRILWPYEFRDCYTREIDTGLYKISPMFDHRLSDIKCWTMGPDIFQRFPELYSDMPAFNHIPQTISQGYARPQGRRVCLPLASSPNSGRTVSIEDVDEEEEIKPLVVGNNYVPMETPTAHAPTQAQIHASQQPPPPAQAFAHSIQNQQQDANPPAYNLADFNTIMALDAFACGAINEGDFATVCQSETLNNYPNIIF